MARASIRTILSLDKYAKIMGINPVFFNGGSQIQLADGRVLFNMDNAQNDIWPQYSWQNVDQVSREDLAAIIDVCEKQIIDYLGFSPAPIWREIERHEFPTHYRPEYSGYPNRYGVDGNNIMIKPNLSHFISGGVRATTLIESDVNVVYTDPDGDGWDELATVVVVVPAGSDVKEVRIYYPGHLGVEEYEIRDPVTKWIAGNTLTATYPSYVMVSPDLYEVFPTNDDDGKFIDLTDPTVFIRLVDVYREYNDTTANHVTFYTVDTANGSVAESGGFIYTLGSQDYIKVAEGSYDAVTGAWSRGYSLCTYSDYVDLWYYSGMRSVYSNLKSTDDYLPRDIATAIAYMATARLERVFYANNNATSLAADLREDLAHTEKDDGYRYIPRDIDNPFGTRVGEYKAWMAISKYKTSHRGGAVI